MAKPRVAILMGSQSDWETMRSAEEALEALGIESRPACSPRIARPTGCGPTSRARRARGIEVVIAGAGGAAHLAGVCAAHTLLPVLGVPIDSSPLQGLDALLATVQMPGGIPVATFAIGKAGAKNAGLFAAAILARADQGVRERLAKWREAQAAAIPDTPL